MAAPTAKVEIEFTTSVWTDVTAYWDAGRPITMTGGRLDTDGRVPPGRMSGMWLDNADGRFTVGNASGAYFPNVSSGKYIRVSIKDPGSSTYYLRFTGRIDGWAVTWADNGNTCWAQVSATDDLTELARQTLNPERAVRAAVAAAHADLPTQGGQLPALNWWPLMDGATGGEAFGYCGTPWLNVSPPPGVAQQVAQVGTAASVGGAGPPSDPRGSRGVVGWPSGYTAFTGQCYPMPALQTWSVDWQVQVLWRGTGTPSSTDWIIGRWSPTHVLGLMLTTTGEMALGSYPAGGSWTTWAGGAGVINDGQWWLLTLGAYDDGGYRAYASAQSVPAEGRGVRTASVSGLSAAAAVAERGWVAGNFGGAVPGECAHLITAMGIGSETPILGPDVFDGVTDTTGLADVAVIAVPTTTRRPLTVDGTIDQQQQMVEATDGGLTYVPAGGTPTYLAGARRTIPADATTPIRMDLTAADVTIPGVVIDRSKIVNDVTVELMVADRVQSTHQVVDAASVATVGRREKSVRAWDVGTAAAAKAVGRLLDPKESPRIPGLSVDMATLSTAQQQSFLFGGSSAPLGAALWTLVAITGLPAVGGLPDRWLGRVEGWTETVGIDEWRVDLATSFAGALVGSATFGVVGTMRLG